LNSSLINLIAIVVFLELKHSFLGASPWGFVHSECVIPLLGLWAAGMLFVSALLLLYTAVIAPAQIFLWDSSDPCNKFPTLYFDVFVDSFFLVRTVLGDNHA
jgi:hypothetical protein